MPRCKYNADNVFKNFKVIEFPKPFLGLEVSQTLDVRMNLKKSAYIQTLYEGKFMDFEDAREVSANHRAFLIELVSENSLKVTFKPTNECIYKAKLQKLLPNRFVICLSVMQIDGEICCSNRAHQEIGRYYISGQYENINIFHKPREINFGDVKINTKSTQNIRIFNESEHLQVSLVYKRVAGLDVCPEKFTVNPKSSKCIALIAKPVSLQTPKELLFKLQNKITGVSNSTGETESNFLSYKVKVNINVLLAYNKRLSPIIESMHKLLDPDERYTYMENELESVLKKKNIALKQLELSKKICKKKYIVQRVWTGRDKCQNDIALFDNNSKNFCRVTVPKISTKEVLSITITPYFVNLGKVGVHTYGERFLCFANNSSCDIEVNFLEDKYVKYTEEKFKTMSRKVKSSDQFYFMIFVYAGSDKMEKGSFPYSINKTYYRQHPYSIHGEHPSLELKESILKFGMVTSENFTTSTSIRIYNYFNESIPFNWNQLDDVPFRINPNSGVVSKKSILTCCVSYDYCKPINKAKTYEIIFSSLGSIPQTVPVELEIVSRKLGVKLLQNGAYFKEIPLNIEKTEKIQLENSSKEIATFFVVEPLLPGITIEPLKGIIRPKTIIVFKIKVQFGCVLEFSCDITIRINGKENLFLPVSAHVVEPDVTVRPKSMYMARVPGDMITYVPVTFENHGTLKSTVQFLDSESDNFDVYVQNRYEKERIFNFTLEGNQSKTVFVKVYDNFRRQFDLFLPFKINDLIGPPTKDIETLELGYYTNQHELKYEHNVRVKVKPVRKEINYVHLWGVITIPWVLFSEDKFELDYNDTEVSQKEFTIKNISKYDLNISIVISKLAPNFSLTMSDNNDSMDYITDDSHIKFELKSGCSAELVVHFHPKGYGRFVCVALMYFLKHTSIPYHNLTFVGRRQEPAMEPNMFHIIFPPCYIGIKKCRMFTIEFNMKSTLNNFFYHDYEDPNLEIEFLDCINGEEKDCCFVTIKVTACSEVACCRYTLIKFQHRSGSYCDVEVCYCYSQCPLTLLASNITNDHENPYPYYPETSSKLYEQMEVYIFFLENWLFLQGFRRELYPTIPEAIHATSTNVVLQAGKSKGVNVSYLNFIRKMAGPLLKLSKKVQSSYHEQSFEQVKDVHDNYKDIIVLLRARGANAWVIQPKYLLSYDQFIIYSQNVSPKCKADEKETEKLIVDENLFNRLNKQCWFDFIIQSYKAFVIDTCFFECICTENEPRDIIKILVNWFNDHITLQFKEIVPEGEQVKKIENIMDHLSDGLAFTSVFLSYCPFLHNHFMSYIEVNEENAKTAVVNNACLVIEAIGILKLFFPISVKDFQKPNFLQMFFLSIHLYVTLPMFKIKEEIHFNPPLLRSSVRQISITPSNQETLSFNYYILNNSRNHFNVEKTPVEKDKKMIVNVKFVCNFLPQESAILLVHGFNKTRIFDTYITFILKGEVASIQPMKKCKVVAPLYRLIKVDILIASPFETSAVFKLYVTDVEPSIPVQFEDDLKPRFYLRRLNPIDQEVTLNGTSSNIKDLGPLDLDQRVYFNLICLSNQTATTYVWFRSEIGEFYIRITTHPRSDSPIEYLQARIETFPYTTCSCGEECECYRTTAVLIPHKNYILMRSLRQSLAFFASELMLKIYDDLIENVTGRIILIKLLKEGGTVMSEVEHIFQNEMTYKISSRTLKLHATDANLAPYSSQMYVLPITLLSSKKSERFSITLTSKCGLNIRTYKILMVTSDSSLSHTGEGETIEEVCRCDLCKCGSC